MLLAMRLLAPAPTPVETAAAPEQPAAPAAPADTPAPSPPPEWERVFSVRSVQPHLHADEVRALVVPAGSHPQATAVAKALEVVLEAGSRVIEAKRAAPVKLDDDAEIVRRVASQGFDRVLVVRVFDVDGRVQAVISVLDREGRTVDAFVAWGDEPLPAVETTALGVREEVIEAIDPEATAERERAAEPSEPPLPPEQAAELAAQARYERWRIVYDPAGRRFYRGSDPTTPLGHVEFYQSVGRGDLAKKHRTRVGAGWGVVAVGIATVVVGVPLVALRAETERGTIVGLSTVLAVGTVTMAVGLPLVMGTPAGLDARVRMAEEHNRKLRRRPTARPKPTLSLHPSVGPRGGGVALAGRFSIR